MPTAAITPEHLAIGLAGWSYTDWKDTVYRLPSPPLQPDLFGEIPVPEPVYPRDELAFIAGYVDMLEVNSSFYRTPNRKTVASWWRRTSYLPGFFFTAKLNQAFTHEFSRDAGLAADFMRAFEPLLERNALNGILCQFRYDYADSADTRQHLEWICRTFAPLGRLIAEVRHKSWQDTNALQFLDNLGWVVANLDYPLAGDSFNARALTTPDFAYLRLHGRNHEGWFASEKQPHDPYNYDYTDTEIDELADRSREILGKTRQLTIVANNHYQGKAVSAAARLKARLLKDKVPVPPALIDTYPALKRIARENSR